MSTRQAMRIAALSLLLLAALSLTAQARPALPENLAPKATAWASSEHNQQYLATFATDGKIPAAGSQAADRGAAWCVLKKTSGDHARFSSNGTSPCRWPTSFTTAAPRGI